MGTEVHLAPEPLLLFPGLVVWQGWLSRAVDSKVLEPGCLGSNSSPVAFWLCDLGRASEPLLISSFVKWR